MTYLKFAAEGYPTRTDTGPEALGDKKHPGSWTPCAVSWWATLHVHRAAIRAPEVERRLTPHGRPAPGFAVRATAPRTGTVPAARF